MQLKQCWQNSVATPASEKQFKSPVKIDTTKIGKTVFRTKPTFPLFIRGLSACQHPLRKARTSNGQQYFIQLIVARQRKLPVEVTRSIDAGKVG